jgi:hypothetical protein
MDTPARGGQPQCSNQGLELLLHRLVSQADARSADDAQHQSRAASQKSYLKR